MKKIFFISLIMIIFVGIIYFFNQPRIHFIHKEIHLSLYQEVEPYSYIERVSHMNIKDIHIQNNVDNTKLGEYHIDYIYNHKVFTLKVFIDDTTPPQYETINTKILKNESVDPKSLVKNIQDDSKTIIYFKENYIFSLFPLLFHALSQEMFCRLRIRLCINSSCTALFSDQIFRFFHL